MFEYARGFLRSLETTPGVSSLASVLPLLREGLGLTDFGELLFSLPNPEFPRISSLLPRMASTEVQAQWTGATGDYLLEQTCAFVRTLAYHHPRLTGRPLDGATVLDYGCGYGRIARLLYYFTDPEQIYGVDPWDRSIALCREAGLGNRFRQSDYLPKDLPLDGRTFDLIYAFSVFTHLSLEAARAAFWICHQYIASGGMLAVTIRPIEYWSLDSSVHALPDTSEFQAKHRAEGFAFSPLAWVAADKQRTFGNTSMTTEWIAANFPEWRVAAVDRSLSDPYQQCVFLRPN